MKPNRLLLLLPLSALLLGACAHTNTLTDHSTGRQLQIYKSDGARQCEGAGMSPEAMLAQLQGITVYSASKQILPNRMYPAVCGGGTGSINVYTIDSHQLPAAEARGFQVFLPARSTP